MAYTAAAPLYSVGVGHPRLFYRTGRSISSSLSKVEGGGHGHEKASQRRASLQAMSPATVRRYAAPPLDLTRDKV